MDDPPEAHQCVQAGKPAPAWGRWGMLALPGVASADRGELPGETQDEVAASWAAAVNWPAMQAMIGVCPSFCRGMSRRDARLARE